MVQIDIALPTFQVISYFHRAVGRFLILQVDTKQVDMEGKGLKASKSPEVILTQAARFAILPGQLNANLPLSLVHGKLCLKYLTPCVIFQGLFHILFILNLVFLGLSSENSSKINSQYGLTEALLMRLGLTASTLLFMCFRIYEFWNRSSTLKFWQRNVNLLESVWSPSTTRVSAEDSANFRELLDKSLAKIRAFLRNSCLITIILVICIHVTALTFYEGSISGLASLHTLSFHFFIFVHLTQVFQGIWICFFLKFYTALYNCVKTKVQVMNSSCSQNEMNKFDSDGRIEAELNECYNLFIKIGDHVKDFCTHFQVRLLPECLFSTFQVIFCIFIFLRWVVELETFTKRIGSVNLILQAAVFGKYLYSLGSDSSRMTRSASEITDELHNLYSKHGFRLSFRSRQTLQIFLMRISSNPPTVDVAHFFTFDRQLISTV